MRHRRAQADLRSRQPRRRAAELLHLRPLRADGATGEDCALHPERDRRLRSGRSGSLARPVRIIAAALAWRHQGLAHRRRCATTGKRTCRSRRAAAALEEAIAFFRELGAKVEDVTLRPLHVLLRRQDRDGRERAVLAAPGELIARPRGLRSGLPRAQPGGLPVHRRGLCARKPRAAHHGDEMRPLYGRFDLFLTANSSAAPRLDAPRSLSFWKRPNLTSPFNCTGGPALALLCGFTRDGLAAFAADRGPTVRRCARPAGRPRLRASQRLGKRAPASEAGAAPRRSTPSLGSPDTSPVEPAVRALAEAAARPPACASGPDHGGAHRGGAMGARDGAATSARSSREIEVSSIFDPGRDLY